MKLQNLFLKNAVLLLLTYALFSATLVAQKKPNSVLLDTNTDDMQLCGGENAVSQSNLINPTQQQNAANTNGQSNRNQTTQSDVSQTNSSRANNLRNSQFCYLFRAYHANLISGNFIGARNNRNEMIEIVRGQIDTYYKLRKDGRSFKIRLFETILDFLQVSGNFAATIMNGDRARRIVNAALGGVQTGRSDYKRNFQVLQTQVLINKMNAKRATILTEITGNLNKSVSGTPSDSYSWYAAKNDLRRYLLAGTFDDALDTLVEETGASVKDAERNLRLVEKRTIVTEFTEEQAGATEKANAVLTVFDTKIRALQPNTEDEQVREKLQKIVTQLRQIPQFNLFFSGRQINQQSKSKDLYDALVDLRRELFISNDRGAILTVEETIIRFGN